MELVTQSEIFYFLTSNFLIFKFVTQSEIFYF